MKERLDILVVRRGLATSREKAKAMIMAGMILADGHREDKPGTMFPDTVELSLKGKPMPYVSRGGLKLEKALKAFSVDLKGLICMDAGSSTGGFTDCMLRNGALKVYSVDVGYGQLDWKLRCDSRVICMEKTNIRYLTPDVLDERPAFISADLSFISLTKVLNTLFLLMADTGCAVLLIKPQFEAGREKVGKKGVVKEPAIHREVIEKVLTFAAECGFYPSGLDYSPIRGPEGNIEYLLCLEKREQANTGLKENEASVWGDKIRDTVDKAHGAFDK